MYSEHKKPPTGPAGAECRGGPAQGCRRRGGGGAGLWVPSECGGYGRHSRADASPRCTGLWEQGGLSGGTVTIGMRPPDRCRNDEFARVSAIWKVSGKTAEAIRVSMAGLRRVGLRVADGNGLPLPAVMARGPPEDLAEESGRLGDADPPETNGHRHPLSRPHAG